MAIRCIFTVSHFQIHSFPTDLTEIKAESLLENLNSSICYTPTSNARMLKHCKLPCEATAVTKVLPEASSTVQSF